MCKLPAALVDLCKSLQGRLSGCLVTRNPENQTITWQTFSDFLISTSVQVQKENLFTRLQYHCIHLYHNKVKQS